MGATYTVLDKQIYFKVHGTFKLRYFLKRDEQDHAHLTLNHDTEGSHKSRDFIQMIRVFAL